LSAVPPGAITIPTVSTLVPAVLMARYFLPQQNAATTPFPVPTVWVEEQHTDTVIITEHPVERGAPITDHAFARGPELTVRLGWRRSGSVDLMSVYQQLLTFKQNRVLFDIQTGKRLYSTMLISEVSVTTDQHSEYVLQATLRCRQLILVSTSVVSVQAAPQNQAIASSTTPATNHGSVPLVPSNIEQAPSGGIDPLTGAPVGESPSPAPPGNGGPAGPIDSRRRF
jgi:hypothetical protein